VRPSTRVPAHTHARARPALTAYTCATPLAPLAPVPPASVRGPRAALRVLRTLPLRLLRAKLAKALGRLQPGGGADATDVWLAMPDGRVVALERARDAHGLDWVGVEDGAELFVCPRAEGS
jgi:hypothetical protein